MQQVSCYQNLSKLNISCLKNKKVRHENISGSHKNSISLIWICKKYCEFEVTKPKVLQCLKSGKEKVK